MTKPLTIEIEENVATQLRRVANDLGETPEQFVARAVAARVEAFNANPFFARKGKGLTREAMLAWLNEKAEQAAPTPDADDLPPPGYVRPR
jgi:hypothetical protein